MARFRAYSSDNSSGGEELDEKHSNTREERPVVHHISPEDDESESDDGLSSSSSSSASTHEDNTIPAHKFGKKSPEKGIRRGKHAPISGNENRRAQGVHIHVSSPSTSQSPPHIQNHAALGADPTIIPWAQHVGVDAQKMHVMQTSLFRMPEEAAALKALNQPQPRSKFGRPSAQLNIGVPLPLKNRKHSRDSDGDGMRFESRERPSFAHDIDPYIHLPSHKYARVETSSSIADGKEGAYIDAGLAMGRSFRVSWGPRGTLVYLGSICAPYSSPKVTANSSIITITKSAIDLTASSTNASSTPSAPPELASKLLQHHLSRTPIIRDEAGVPFASPTSQTLRNTSLERYGIAEDVTEFKMELSFSSFSSLFPITDTSDTAALFRLGNALFDPIDLHLSSTDDSGVTPDIRNKVMVFRRKAALSKWLEDDVKPSVDADLRLRAIGNISSDLYTPADAAFTCLTGHQIDQASTIAADSNYLKLATLISQAGGDAVFKDDILSQLAVWKAEKLDSTTSGTPEKALVNRSVWKIFNLLGGLFDDTGEAGPLFQAVWEGLDWKRVFGLCLWYKESLGASISNVVQTYDNLWRQNSRSIARPISSWALEVKRNNSSLHLEAQPEDPLYNLIKLYSDPVLSLSQILDPKSFAPLGTFWGFGMCWHLYILLSRITRVRDFNDRGDPGMGLRRNRKADVVNGASESVSSGEDEDDDDDVEGHSPSADLLTSGYAFVLESWGMIQEAAFVLLHIEGSVGREKAIKDILARNAPLLDEWVTRGMVGSLKIPMSWVDEAKALYSFSQGDFFSSYELYVSAGLYNAAHEIAIQELAPDAIIRKDYELLKSLFEQLDSAGRREKVIGWFVRGKIFLEYVDIKARFPKLHEDLISEQEEGLSDVFDAVQAEELAELSRRIPKIISIIPDILCRSTANDARHVAAVEEIMKDLLFMMEKIKPTALSMFEHSTLKLMDTATKLDLIRSTACAHFQKNFDV